MARKSNRRSRRGDIEAEEVADHVPTDDHPTEAGCVHEMPESLAKDQPGKINVVGYDDNDHYDDGDDDDDDDDDDDSTMHQLY